MVRPRVLRVLSILLLSTAAAALADAPTTAPSQMLRLRVIDKSTNQPLSKTPVKVAYSEAKDLTVTTDDNGIAQIPFTPGEIYLAATSQAKGYVPTQIAWSSYGQKTPKQIPSEYTLPVEHGTKLSGRVIDDAGQGVPGATVVMHVRNKNLAEGQHIAIVYTKLKTKDDGAWSYDLAPSQIDAISLGAYHLQYANPGGYGYYPMDDFKDLAKLRDGSATFILRRGVKIEGVVLDADGKPISGATIGTGSDRVASNVLPDHKTDAAGHFTLAAIPNDPVTITAKANGHSPEIKQFTMGNEPQTIEFHLQPAHTLKGRVIDDAGKPIPGVSVYVDTWHGMRTLNASMTTKSDGAFTWKNAPADAVLVDIYKSGYADARGQSMVASEKEITVTLHQPLHVQGTVVDAETGKPVENFRVIKGISFGPDSPLSWLRSTDDIVKSRPGGKFDYINSFPYPGYVVRVQADGYLPADSRVFTQAEREVTLDFKLTKGKSLSGVITTSDGKPATNVTVAIATTSTVVYLQNGARISEQGNETATTDPAGRYTLPAQVGTFKLVAFGDPGYAEKSDTDLKQSPDIQLSTWAKVQGLVKIGSKPAPLAEIELYNAEPEQYDPKSPRAYLQYNATSDATGHFTVDHLKPGTYYVGRQVRAPMSNGGFTSGQASQAKITVAPGQFASVTIGGAGRPIVGRIQIPPEVAALPSYNVDLGRLTTTNHAPEITYPDEYVQWSPEQRHTWYLDFLKTDKGKQYKAALDAADASHHSYSVAITHDGQFRADDIPPGAYTFSVQIGKPANERTCGPGDIVATACKSINVPEMPTQQSDEPLDIGTVMMTPLKTMNVGDTAPDFTVKTLDGKDLKLSDYKGKYILLDFWATWCGPCVAEIPHIKAAYDAFGADPRFAMISLSLDANPAQPKHFIEKNEIKWAQGFLGEWSKTELPDTYSVHSIPAVFLISPDGKILAKDMRGADIKTKIESALAK